MAPSSTEPGGARPAPPVRIDQVVPSLGRRDAVGVHVLHLRDVLRQLGFRSDIWVKGVFPELRHEARLVGDLPASPRPDTWWLYHLAVGSPLADVLAARAEPLLVDHHNVTPAELLGHWLPWATASAEEGRRQVAGLATRAAYAFADSAYNERELHAAGYRHTAVVPPLFDTGAVTPDPTTVAARTAQRADGVADWLFVGRLAPNKAQHDLVKALVCAQRWLGARCRLHLVGTGLGDAYPAAVRQFAQRLGVAASVRVIGMVDDAVLAAYYATADVFVSASEHEGFGIPLVEAMAAGVPVVAYDAGAVAETVGDGGLVVGEKSPMHLAAAVQRVLGDAALRRGMVAAGRRRAATLALGRTQARWRSVVERAITTVSSGPGGMVSSGPGGRAPSAGGPPPDRARGWTPMSGASG